MVKKAIITDLEGTICFTDNRQGITLHEDYVRRDYIAPESCAVYQRLIKPHERKLIRQPAYALVEGDTMFFFGTKTYDLLARIKEKDVKLIYATATRLQTMRKRMQILHPADVFILENGCSIFYGESLDEEDKGWFEYITQDNVYDQLGNLKAHLEKENFNVETKERKLMTRVRLPREEREEHLKGLVEILTHEIHGKRRFDSLTFTENLGYVDIIPARAGKKNAASYLFKKMFPGYETIAIGDDINDLGMLEEADRAIVLGSGHPRVIRIAREKKKHLGLPWTVTPQHHFKGINEALQLLLKEIEQKPKTR